MSKRFTLVPVELEDANAFVERHHRHHRRVQGHKLSIAATLRGEDEIVGVAIVSRPTGRHQQDGWTLEVTRLCAIEGAEAEHVCSFLYGAAWRAALALGYRRLLTYTLATEPGTSLKAAGYRLVGEVKGRSWDRPKRPRVDKHPTFDKLRWERAV